MSVYVLQITHKHGDNVSAHKSQQGALDALAEYVDEWWDQEVGASQTKPAAAGEMIQEYFAAIEGRECFEIHECEMQD